MKIAVCSDLHLEFADLDLINTENADVLILSGDIMIACELEALEDSEEISKLVPTRKRFKAERYRDFMQRCSERFPHVIMVAGNHEHYHGDFQETIPLLKKTFEYLPNVKILHNESVTINDQIFVGGTLWTDMNKEDPMTIHAIKDMMNDFNCVKNGLTQRKVPLYKKDSDGKYLIDDATGFYIAESFKFKDEPAKFSPAHAVEDHRKFLDFLKIMMTHTQMPLVVVGHHAPSRRSTHPKYAGQTLMNGGYSSELDEFIMDHPQIKLWTHGHTHEDFDYMIGETRVVCNPRGYKDYESRADNFALLYVDI